MSQTPPSTLGAQAAAAATTNNKAPTGTAPAAAKPADADAKAAADKAAAEKAAADAKAAADKADANAAGEAPKNKNPNKLYVLVGEVLEFETPAKAEKFLNSEDAPATYSVVRGKKLKTNNKVSLR